MRINDFINEEKVRLDPKCWTGKKIGNPKTKVKGGVRVNNCVPAESVAEGADERKQNALWAQITDYEKRAKATKNDIKKNHLMKMADDLRAKLAVNEGEVVQFPKKHRGDISNMHSCPKCGGDTQGGKYQGHEVQVCMPCKQVYLPPNSGIDQQGNKIKEGVAEGYNAEYDDEAGMADNNLETLERAVQGIDDLIQDGDNLPEWCQEKIAVAKSMLVAVWDYMYSEEASDEVDPEIDAMFEAMDQLAEEMAVKHGVDVDTVWETFEAMDDNMLYETAAWRRKEGKSKSGGLNAKGVASYRRENPGSKLQTAVTTKPSKLKPGSKAAKRRKSFCARMGGVKGPMKKPNGKPTRKALALRKWNC
jgi:hypothetical protein